MGQPNYAYCKNCKGHRDEVGTMSWTRLCLTCGLELQADNIEGMATGRTRERQRWRRALALSIGAVLLDDLPAFLDTARNGSR